MQETKKKVNILAIVSASIAIFVGIFGILFGGVSLYGLTEGDPFLSLIGYMVLFLKDGGDSTMFGLLELMVLAATLLILVGGVLGLIGGITGKQDLLRAAKIIGVVAIPVGTVFYWAETALWLAGNRLFLTSNFICWLLGLAFSITMLVANRKPKVAVE